jgi:hypothetical protein
VCDGRFYLYQKVTVAQQVFVLLVFRNHMNREQIKTDKNRHIYTVKERILSVCRCYERQIVKDLQQESKQSYGAPFTLLQW